MQYLNPVGCGPSGNTWPKCASHWAQTTSTRRIPYELSDSVRTFSFAMGAEKLGQPVPDSNFVSDENNSAPQQTH